jgi:hypothetical protein
MIRQAHTYLVGALSGVVVIGIAIAAFVVLVSAQVFHDLPIPALSSGDQNAAAVSQGKALSSPDHQAVATTGGVGTPQTSQGNTNVTPTGGAQNGANNSQPRAHHQGTSATPTGDATGPAEVVGTAPTTSTGTGNEESTSGGGNSGGSRSSKPSSNSNAPTSSPNTGGNSGGGNPTSTSGTSGGGGGNSAPTTTSGNSGAPTTGTSGGGTTTTTSPPSTPVTTAKPSEALTEGIDGAVGTVNEATGGTLSETGVTHVTEEVVKGAAGPESVVGKTVDGVGEVVGGLLGGNGQ